MRSAPASTLSRISLSEALDAIEAERVLPPAVVARIPRIAGQDARSGNEALLHRVADRGRPNERSLGSEWW